MTLASLIEKLSEHEVWLDYLAYRRANAYLNKREEAELARFIENREWLPVTQSLALPESCLGIPEKRLINKMGKAKKRVVYCFEPAEQQVLKLLAWLLYAYDNKQPAQCYSFRRGYGAHKAIRHLVSLPAIDSLFCYKVDIHDYFNSIHIDKLLPLLASVLADDEQLYHFFVALLTADEALIEGELISEKRGVMAGTPTAPFLANLYLMELDHVLTEQASAYARYSDDIIMFGENAEHIEELRLHTGALLESHGLMINPAKEHLTEPGETWEFLGIAYKQGTVDLSMATQQKLKGKIRRKARALRRWMLRKEATPERAVAAMIRSMNRKLFDGGGRHELTWARWFFPLITTSQSLAALDAYMQQELRTIATGKHSKLNYRMSYDKLKELGYRSLVNEYYGGGHAVINGNARLL